MSTKVTPTIVITMRLIWRLASITKVIRNMTEIPSPRFLHNSYPAKIQRERLIQTKVTSFKDLFSLTYNSVRLPGQVDLVPSDSYFTQFLHVNDEYFSPLRGYKANIYTGDFNVSHLESMDWLDKKLSALVMEERVLESYNSWWRDFTDYFRKDDINASFQNLTDESFSSILSDFLFSKSGSQHRHSFELEEELQCGSPVGNISATSFGIEYLAFDGPGEHVPGKGTVEALLRESGLEEAFSFNKIYLAWETDTIIGQRKNRSLNCVTFV